MKFLIQRVTEASVAVDGKICGEIGCGFLLFIGIAPEDTKHIADKLIEKLLKLRIFEDENGAMNRSIIEKDGSILAISQFTLYADTTHGNRPGFSTAARPEIAEPLYDYICKKLREKTSPDKIATGIFGADMKIKLLNDGPCTFMLHIDEKTSLRN